jgi:hypothetical protein
MVVAVRFGVAVNVAAVWSQGDAQTAASDPVIGPLSCGDGGAPRGIRTPNRQIRSLVTVGLCAYTTRQGATPVDGVVNFGSAARAGDTPVSRSRRSEPGCRGEDLIKPGA